MRFNAKKLCICAGVDVMADRIEVGFWAFGADGAMWPHASASIPALGPDKKPQLGVLYAQLSAPQCVAGVMGMNVSAVAIDCGGHFTHAVLRFVQQHAHADGPKLLAVKFSVSSQDVLMRAVAQDLCCDGTLHAGAATVWVCNMRALQAPMERWFAAQCPGPALPDTAVYAKAAHHWLCTDAGA